MREMKVKLNLMNLLNGAKLAELCEHRIVFLGTITLNGNDTE